MLLNLKTMKKQENLKEIVRTKYAEIATADASEKKSCCGPTCCTDEFTNTMAESYEGMEGYVAAADLGLGCGLPTSFAAIKPGSTVVDLGSGAGNDCFVARFETGEKGKVIGVDMTPEMISKARKNAAKLGYDNVEFRLGELENLPLLNHEADIVISNCVLNLVPYKQKAFGEIYRVLKPGGHFSISDIVTTGFIPEKFRNIAELYAGCISGALDKDAYLDIISQTGFTGISIQSEKKIGLPDEFLSSYLSEEEIKEFRASHSEIISISISAQKPENKSAR